MTYSRTVSTVTPFVVVLLAVWGCGGVLLWSVGAFDIVTYYMVMYVFSLGVLELASSSRLQLPSRIWLNRAIVIGFLGWVVSLLLYLN